MWPAFLCRQGPLLQLLLGLSVALGCLGAAQLSDPGKAAHFVELLAAAPVFPWHVDVHTHAHGLTSFIVEALASSFPLADKVVVKKGVSVALYAPYC